MSLDRLFFISNIKKKNPENILAMQSTVHLYNCLYAKETDLSHLQTKFANSLITSQHLLSLTLEKQSFFSVLQISGTA